MKYEIIMPTKYNDFKSIGLKPNYKIKRMKKKIINFIFKEKGSDFFDSLPIIDKLKFLKLRSDIKKLKLKKEDIVIISNKYA